MSEQLQRFWVSWWSGYYMSEGCTRPPFQIWESGQRPRKDGKTELSFCAVIDATGEKDIVRAIDKHFPDAEMRFCNQVENDYQPGSRFPNYQNKTRLEP